MRCTLFKEVRLLVCLVVILFGMGSWIAINGLWVELPILVDQLPEGWNLPSYMTVIIQIANIGPILFTVCNLLLPDKVQEKPVVFLMVIIGAAASLLLAFFWDRTSEIAGQQHSTALLLLMFFLSLVDCTSSVVFLPFMNIFKPQYMIFYFIGEGFSGLVPSLVALGQGVGRMECLNTSFVNESSNDTEYQIQATYFPPHFPVEDFFFFLFGMMVVCGLAFTMLNYLPYCKAEHTHKNSYVVTEKVVDPALSDDSYELNPGQNLSSREGFIKPSDETDVKSHGIDIKSEVPLSFAKYIYFLMLTAFINALANGILPSVQSYACLPYGTSSYHLSATLASIANPVACFIAFFISINSALAIGIITVIGAAISGYILVLANGSPTPLLVNTVTGSVLVVSAYVLVYLLLTYSKVTIATLFRKEGRKALLWFGVVTQIGSAVGAVITFVIINIYQLFVQKYPCT